LPSDLRGSKGPQFLADAYAYPLSQGKSELTFLSFEYRQGFVEFGGKGLDDLLLGLEGPSDCCERPIGVL